MNFKKIALFAMSAMLMGSAVVQANDEVLIQETIEEKQPAFIKVSGEIDSSEVRGDLVYYFNDDERNPFYLVVSKNTLIFDNTGKVVTLNEGDRVTAYVDSNKPMLMIYPPQYSPDVVIVETSAEHSAVVGRFDENLVDAQLSLKLNISNDTTIENEAGEKIATADFKGGYAVIFYSMTTKSIPAQTTPSKIIVLDAPEVKQAKQMIDTIIGEDHYEVNGVKMVPLRKVAEYLGYTVTSTGRGAIISKGIASYTLTRGEKMYGYNKALYQFTEAPALLETSKTYVEYDFALQLSKLRLQ